MPRHTATAVTFEYHEKRKRQAPSLDLTQLPGGGDFIDLAIEAWPKVGGKVVEKQRVFEAGEVNRYGRCVLFKGRVGHYGDAGKIRDIQTGESIRDHEGELTNEPEVRMVLALPPGPGSLIAVLVVEIVQEGSLKNRFIEAVKSLWDSRFPAWTLTARNVVEAEAWLKTAEMTKVQVTYVDNLGDIANSSETPNAGTLTSTLIPAKGTRFEPAVFQKIKGNKKAAGKLLGFEVDGRAPDSATVTMVGREGRQKQFDVDREATPMLRWVFTDYGTPNLADDDFQRRCLNEADDILSRTGARWDVQWENSSYGR